MKIGDDNFYRATLDMIAKIQFAAGNKSALESEMIKIYPVGIFLLIVFFSKCWRFETESFDISINILVGS